MSDAVSGRKGLKSVVEVLHTRQDVQDVIRRLMAPDDALETFNEIGVENSDLARGTLESAVAALANSQGVLAIDAELKRRYKLN